MNGYMRAGFLGPDSGRLLAEAAPLRHTMLLGQLEARVEPRCQRETNKKRTSNGGPFAQGLRCTRLEWNNALSRHVSIKDLDQSLPKENGTMRT
jgi:hypothetical protein